VRDPALDENTARCNRRIEELERVEAARIAAMYDARMAACLGASDAALAEADRLLKAVRDVTSPPAPDPPASDTDHESP